jgi:hypothetical protein
MYAIYGNICHQYTPNVSIYTIHGSYGISHKYLGTFPKNNAVVVLDLGPATEVGIIHQNSLHLLGVVNFWSPTSFTGHPLSTA